MSNFHSYFMRNQHGFIIDIPLHEYIHPLDLMWEYSYEADQEGYIDPLDTATEFTTVTHHALDIDLESLLEEIEKLDLNDPLFQDLFKLDEGLFKQEEEEDFSDIEHYFDEFKEE